MSNMPAGEKSDAAGIFRPPSACRHSRDFEYPGFGTHWIFSYVQHPDYTRTVFGGRFSAFYGPLHYLPVSI
jgi:hypothetical protein